MDKDPNFNTLSKNDPSADAIVDQASQVAVYTYVGEGKEWRKTDIEGPIFLYSRSAAPHYSLFVLNRASPKNLIEPLTADIEFSTQQPTKYLFFRKNGVIHGIWFHDEKECWRLYLSIKKYQSMGNTPADTSASGPAGGDIMSMLSRAQQKATNSPVVNGQPVPLPRAHHAVAPLQMPSPIHPQHHNIPPPIQTQLHQPGGQSTPNSGMPGMLQQLFNVDQTQQQSPQPNAGTDLLARLQRNDNSSEHQPVAPIPGGSNVISASDLERQLKSMPEMSNNAANSHNSSAPAPNTSTAAPISQPQPHVSTLFAPAQLAGASSNPQMNAGKNNSLFDAMGEDLDDSNMVYNSSVPGALLTPHDLASRSSELNVNGGGMSNSNNASITGLTRNFSMMVNVGSPKGSMISLANASTTQTSPSSIIAQFGGHAQTAPEVTPLTRDQMVQAMNYMLKNDPSFVTQLHEAYVRSLRETLSQAYRS